MCGSVYDKKKSETISIVIENLMFQKCAEAPKTTLTIESRTKSSPGEEWMNFLLFGRVLSDTILRSCRRQRRWYLEHERNIYKLFPFISISIPFIMWQVSASFLFAVELWSRSEIWWKGIWNFWGRWLFLENESKFARKIYKKINFWLLNHAWKLY